MNEAAAQQTAFPASSKIDSSSRFSFKARIVNDARYNTFNWEGQFNPKVYSRLYFYPEISFGLIPINGRLNLSTESLNLPNQSYSQYRYNSFSLRFDSREFQSRLEAQLKQRAATQITKEVNPYLDPAKDSLRYYQGIAHELRDPKYLQKLANYSRTLADTAIMDSFSLSQNRVQITQAKSGLSKHADKLKKVERLPEWQKKVEDLEIAERDKQIPKPTMDSLVAKERKSLPDIYKIASSVRDFQVGICSPVLTPFTMMGLSLNGGYTQIKAGRILASAGYGSTFRPRFNIFSPDDFNIGNSRLFIGGIGYQFGKTGQVNARLLKTQDNYFRGTTWNRQPVDNAVLSLEAKQEIKCLKIEAEFAQSGTVSRAESKPGESAFKAIGTPNGLKNQAVRLEGTVNITKTKTVIQTKGRVVGRDFRSEGTPYLRSDIAGFSAGVKQYFWKKYLFVQADAGKEFLNLSQLKENKTSWTNLMVQAGIAIPRLPVITAGYMPTRQFYEYIDSDSGIYSAMDMKFIQLSHILYVKDIPVTVMALYSDAKSSTIHYEFLNRNILADVSADLSDRYTVHSAYMQSTATYLDRPINYKDFVADISRKQRKTVYSLGLQSRSSDLVSMQSLFGVYTATPVWKQLSTSLRIEVMNLERKTVLTEPYNTPKKTIEAGGSILLTYSF